MLPSKYIHLGLWQALGMCNGVKTYLTPVIYTCTVQVSYRQVIQIPRPAKRVAHNPATPHYRVEYQVWFEKQQCQNRSCSAHIKIVPFIKFVLNIGRTVIYHWKFIKGHKLILIKLIKCLILIYGWVGFAYIYNLHHQYKPRSSRCTLS